jgi:Type VI secretion system/phage-baseplate injector OB domain
MNGGDTATAGVESALERGADRFYGKYRGLVRNTTDPLQLGRIQASVPEVLGDAQTGWALPCAPYGGTNCGLFTIPPVGAGVWIEFEAGDVSRPIWSGCWWGSDQRPKNEKGTQATPSLKIVRSEKGLMVSLDDSGQVISVSDEDGSNILTIEVQAGKITVKGATKAVVEAPQIELVENATHPVVFGDDLVQYLNQLGQIYQTHTHPGEMALGSFPVTPAPPVPPFPPATPALLSTKVKTG